MSITNSIIADSLKEYDKTAKHSVGLLTATEDLKIVMAKEFNQEPEIDQLIEAEIETALGLPPNIPVINNEQFVKKFKFRK